VTRGVNAATGARQPDGEAPKNASTVGAEPQQIASRLTPPDRRSGWRPSSLRAGGRARPCSSPRRGSTATAGCDGSDDQRVRSSHRYLAPLGLRPDVSARVASQVEVVDGNGAKPHARGRAHGAREAANERVRFWSLFSPVHAGVQRSYPEPGSASRRERKQCAAMRTWGEPSRRSDGNASRPGGAHLVSVPAATRRTSGRCPPAPRTSPPTTSGLPLARSYPLYRPPGRRTASTDAAH
jgi:hypothetical protein